MSCTIEPSVLQMYMDPALLPKSGDESSKAPKKSRKDVETIEYGMCNDFLDASYHRMEVDMSCLIRIYDTLGFMARCWHKPVDFGFCRFQRSPFPTQHSCRCGYPLIRSQPPSFLEMPSHYPRL